MRIIIVGGGIAGLAAAAALRRAGADPLVLEQAPELLQVGAGVNLSANGMKALAYIGADQHIRSTSVLSEGAEFNDLETGTRIGSLSYGSAGEAAWGESFYHVHRPDLLDALLKVVPAADLRLASEVVGVEQAADGVVVHLADGEAVSGDALAGADGLRSPVRTSLFGEQPAHPTGYVAWRSLIDAAKSHGIDDRPLGRTWIGRRRHVVFYPVAGGRLLNFVGFVPDEEVAHRESWTASGDVADLRQSFSVACEEVQTIVGAVEEAFITAIYFREPLPSWGTGPVTLLGDAAHPVPPSAAQGACMALEDGVLLGRALERFGDLGIERVFREYESRRMPRTARLFGTAMNNFRTFNQSDPVEVRGRNGRMKGLERLDPLSEATWGWLYVYDPVGAIDDPAPAQGLAAAATQNPLKRTAARAAFEQWRDALQPGDFARGEVGIRAGLERFMSETFPPDPAVTTSEIDCGGVTAIQVSPSGTLEGPVVLHLHGGLYTMGSARSSVEYASRMASAVDGWALIVDYRLAPEHEYPHALDDALAAYRWLLETSTSKIIFSGQDAGAGLATALALTARDRGLRLPDALFLVSPWCDLSLQSQTITENAGSDPWISRHFLAIQGASYIHEQDPALPLISPVNADLKGLPPMAIFAAAGEVLVGDAKLLARRATEAELDVRLTLVEDSVHDFTLFADLPETVEALSVLGGLAGRSTLQESPA